VYYPPCVGEENLRETRNLQCIHEVRFGTGIYRHTLQMVSAYSELAMRLEAPFTKGVAERMWQRNSLPLVMADCVPKTSQSP